MNWIAFITRSSYHSNMYDKRIEYIYLKTKYYSMFTDGWVCLNEIDLYKMHNMREGISSYTLIIVLFFFFLLRNYITLL